MGTKREMSWDFVRANIIGRQAEIETPFGTRRVTYADYTASGRALRQVEDYMAEEVLPYYANSHTEASFCGAYTTGLREEARALIAAQVNAGDDCSVIFTGSGATAAVNRLVALCGVADCGKTSPATLANRFAALFHTGRHCHQRTAGIKPVLVKYVRH